jgi:diacylglycerol kinase family enzyme
LRVVFIGNLKAGPNRYAREPARPWVVLAEEFRERGWHATYTEVDTGIEVIAAAKLAIAGGAEIVVACGGDGTVSAVASVVAGTRAALAVIPAGTLNHFARDLQIPLDPAKAGEVILAGHKVRIDVGEVNGLRFVNNSSLGLYPNIVRYREGRRKTGSGRILAFAAACLLSLRRYRSLELRLEVDGVRSRRVSPFLFVGNNKYAMEGLRLGHREKLDEGRLYAYLADRAGRFGLLRIAVSALLHGLRLNHDFVILPAQILAVQTKRRHIRVALDGETLRLHPPLHYSIRPGLLQVVVPRMPPGPGIETLKED